MLKLSFLTSLIALSLLLSACSKDESTSDEANSILSTNEFLLTGLDNTQYTVKKSPSGFSVTEAAGKVIIIDIFATWCPPCQAEASHLSSLQKKYKDSLLVLGVTVENNIKNKKLQKFRTEYHANYPLVNSSENARFIDAVAEKLKIGSNFGIPLMAMYKDGVLINFYQGAVEEEFLESDIKKALGL
ncbi:TlpA family protein disulfide reductase [Sulfurimonas sp. SAG-AH-194-C21]|nr:TlpA disulfide reductase family protein [Sulfurimonas sp. SAG-AH-194-C21]MDF1884259.1 TlpA family protein disulfide reductase [Sulfurimonas sp. SAG-AH-194-C21]